MTDNPKTADKAIELLEGLVELLHYFYMEHENFRKDVLVPATEIENTLKGLALDKEKTFKRINDKYAEYYKKKQETNVASITDAQLNDSVTQRYRHDFGKDRK